VPSALPQPDFVDDGVHCNDFALIRTAFDMEA
jgi:hypothetical protein